MTGYLHPDYAASLSEFGTPRALPLSGGWILERQVPGFPDKDGTGCYPIFTCRDWSNLSADLSTLADEIICLSLVTDPFGPFGLQELHESFPYVVFPFKLHYVTDLSMPRDIFVHEGHRRNALRALRNLTVECSNHPVSWLDDWCRLYANLIERHRIKGLAAFSQRSFAMQLQIPGILAFRAIHEESTVGMILWYVHKSVAYYHLGAYDDNGYSLRASFALFWYAIDHLSELGVEYLSLGAGAGLTDTPNSGLNRFKKGWSTGTRVAYFCGRVFNSARYLEINRIRQVPSTTYFPAYRQGEYAQ